MRKIQVVINVDLKTLKLIEEYDMNVEEVFREAVEIERDIILEDRVAKEIEKLITDKRGTLTWGMIRGKTGVEDKKLITEAALQVMEDNPKVRISRNGIRWG